MNDSIFQSQHGEDALVLDVFDKPGYFVEIGAVDGVYLSNTYDLEQRGWTGLLVEAHPHLFAKLEQNRPNASLAHAAVAETDGELIFYATEVGSLSTFDREQRDYFIKNRSEVNEDSYTEFKVRAASVTTLLDEAKAPKIIDMMSIDIEGAELPALKGFDFDRYDARVLVIEKDDARAKQAIEEEISQLLTDKGYRVARRLGANDFWVKEDALFASFVASHVRATLASGKVVDMPAGASNKKRGFFKRISDSIRKRLG